MNISSTAPVHKVPFPNDNGDLRAWVVVHLNQTVAKRRQGRWVGGDHKQWTPPAGAPPLDMLRPGLLLGKMPSK